MVSLALCGMPYLAGAAYHVATNGAHVPPFSSWATAATNIQAAVDAAVVGTTVLVADGHYLLTSEIKVDKSITIQSVNGPASTIVNGKRRVRCFNVGNAGWACVISGLTITNGYTTSYGGGVYCTGTNPVFTNCVIAGNMSYYGGGMYNGTANNCTISGNTGYYYGGGMNGGMANNSTISGNTAYYGGGMYNGMAYYCAISGNTAKYGGGMLNVIAENCTISGNTADKDGGGMLSGMAYMCIIGGNTANNAGGGIYGGTVDNCTISGNTADKAGGGMYGGTVDNCTINGNTTDNDGGGMYGGTANSCTISGNTAKNAGGGMNGGTANNCIVWYNEASTGNDLRSTSARYTCSPDAMHGANGCITNAPQLVSGSHVAANSPCRGAGSMAYAIWTDIDGEAWLNPPSMGCDEYHGSVTGTLDVAIEGVVHVVVGLPARLFGAINGATTGHVWDFGDGTTATNVVYPKHTWSSPGSYAVVLTAYNDSWPDGVSATQTVSVAASLEGVVVYVSKEGNDANDGAGWATAKATIQAGIDAQHYVGGLVLVGDGTYALSSEIGVKKAITIQSVNGPNVTIVDGKRSTRCFNLGSYPCILSGFTIQNGYVEYYGGGVYCKDRSPVVTNCVLRRNEAWSAGGEKWPRFLNQSVVNLSYAA